MVPLPFQECQSPHFNMSTSSSSKPLYPSHHRGHDTPPLPHNATPPSFSSYRRSSLQQINASLMRSEPNLHRRSSLDPATLHHLSDPFSNDLFHDLPHSLSHSLGKINSSSYFPLSPGAEGGGAGGGGGGAMHHQLHTSSSPHGSNSQLCGTPHGSNSQLSNHGSNSKLNHHSSNSSLLSGDGGGGGMRGPSAAFPSYPTPDDIIKETDRSKSLGNIFSCIQTQPLQRHHLYQDPQAQPQGDTGGQVLNSPALPPAAPPPPPPPVPSAMMGGKVGGAGAMQSSQTQKRRKNFSLGGGLGRNSIKRPR